MLMLVAAAFIAAGFLVLGGGDPAPDPASSPSDPASPAGEPPAGTREAAPDFALDLFDGSRFSLSGHLSGDGRPVILNLWASWCAPCRAEMPHLDEAAAARPDVLIIGVAVDDDPQAARAFGEEIGVTYPTGFDEGDRVGRRYPAPGLPATYVISADGYLLRTVFGRLTPDDIDDLVAVAVGDQTE